jgi:hypothetical protein
MTMLVVIAKQVGRPKFLFPTSENACPVTFRSFVHRTTSHGAEEGSGSGAPWNPILAKDDCRECELRKAGDTVRGLLRGEAERRDWNLRSNGRCRPVGLAREPGLRKEGASLLGEDRAEP